MEKEHTLPSGQTIVLTNEHKYPHPTKPWQVSCWNDDGSCHWSKDFTTQEEAEKEYVRFD